MPWGFGVDYSIGLWVAVPSEASEVEGYSHRFSWRGPNGKFDGFFENYLFSISSGWLLFKQLVLHIVQRETNKQGEFQRFCRNRLRLQ